MTMPPISATHRYIAKRRRGSMTIFACIVFIALISLAGLAVNLAYIELVRTEQRLATDASAKAALVALSQTQSATQARQMARNIAASHRVGGRSVVLADSDIQIGSSTRQANGEYTFVQSNSNSVTNSVKVTSNLSRLAGGGAQTILPSWIGTDLYVADQSATSTRIEMDVSLVVDRSGSMAWTLGATRFTYPDAPADSSVIQNYFQLPHASLSRWSALSRSVDVFLDVLDESPIRTRVALASYASNFTFGIWTSRVASIDQTLTTDYARIRQGLDTIASQPLIGNTNIAAGLREGINALNDSNNTRITSSKCIILLTDGLLSQGDDPVALAAIAREMNIRIHTIAFSAQADVSLMRRVAEAGGGQTYYAPDAASLESAFRAIAVTLPNMLTQ